ncbi:hypothetical protein LJR219_002678 [Phenylobacterium sp. LjRoot219]|uniref:hypothetical protein n=1 Tax=Phenylobacterium sp. LjRoot219 TaxID=3342283 RepID=UPI003ECEACD6
MDDVRYLTDGDLTYIEFDTITCRMASQKSWPLLDQLNQAVGREASGTGGPPPAAAQTRLGARPLSLGHYAAPSSPAGRDLPLQEIFSRLAQPSA